MGDSLEITDNKYIVEACKRQNENIIVNGKTIKRFLIPTDFTPKSSIKRKYNWKDLADVDIKCSSNKIGEIINLAQMLNSIYWDKKNNNSCSEEELLELYKDICQLDILSCIEIDRCKKLSPVNAKKELDRIRNKHYLDKGTITRNKQQKQVGVRPYFFKYLDGGKDYKFKKFKCGMDYLNKILDEDINIKDYEDNIPIVDLLEENNLKTLHPTVVTRFKDKILKMRADQQTIWMDKQISNKFECVNEIYSEFLNSLKIELSNELMYFIFLRISKSDKNENYKEYKTLGKIMLQILYDKDKKAFLNNIKIKSKNIKLIEDKNGEIDLYGLKFTKNA